MKKLLLVFLIGSLLILNITIVNACSYVPKAPPQESLEQSTAVFAGRVIDIDAPFGLIIGTGDPVEITFEVSRIWKGADYKNIVLTTARDSVSCGYPFEKNKEYLVYANGEDNALTTGIYSRTNLFSDAQGDLEELGDGKLPINHGSNYASQTSNLVLIIIAGGIIILIIIIILLAKKYRK
ncbi:MAG: hypothetical protein Q8Q42_00705 [Nanoarchaeota archaeon]|nr:hypothetical protein [Nanoarchaeota archaeon]